MVTGNRKEKFSRESPTPSENRLIAFPKNKGFEPGSLGENAVALPLAPPPLPAW